MLNTHSLDSVSVLGAGFEAETTDFTGVQTGFHVVLVVVVAAGAGAAVGVHHFIFSILAIFGQNLR